MVRDLDTANVLGFSRGVLFKRDFLLWAASVTVNINIGRLKVEFGQGEGGRLDLLLLQPILLDCAGGGQLLLVVTLELVELDNAGRS